MYETSDFGDKEVGHDWKHALSLGQKGVTWKLLSAATSSNTTWVDLKN